MDDIVSWCKTGLQELNSLAQDRRRWKLITRQAMDTNGRWSHGSWRRHIAPYTVTSHGWEGNVGFGVALAVRRTLETKRMETNTAYGYGRLFESLRGRH